MGITVYTTAPDETTSEQIAKECVEAKLAACCNLNCNAHIIVHFEHV